MILHYTRDGFKGGIIRYKGRGEYDRLNHANQRGHYARDGENTVVVYGR